MSNSASTLGQFLQRELQQQFVMREQQLLAQIEAEAAALVIAPATHEARKPHQNALAKARKHYDRLNEARELVVQLLTSAVHSPWLGDLESTAAQCQDRQFRELLLKLHKKLASCGL